eukprot:gene28053-34850_t
MVQIVYREFDIAERNRNMRQLERQLNDNIAGLRRLEEERRLNEVRLMAVCEYEGLRHEWDVAKQNAEKKNANSNTSSSSSSSSTVDISTARTDVVSSTPADVLHDDVQSITLVTDETESGVNDDSDKVSLSKKCPEGEQTGDGVKHHISDADINAQLVASLRIDISFTGRMLVLLDQICVMAGLEYFAGLRDCYRQVNALLVRHVHRDGAEPQAVIEGLATDPDLRGVVLQRLQETDSLSFSLKSPQLSASSSDFMSANRRAKLLLAASQAFNGAPLPNVEDIEEEEGEEGLDDMALSLEARGRLMMQRYNEQIDRQKREAAEALAVETSIQSEDAIVNSAGEDVVGISHSVQVRDAVTEAVVQEEDGAVDVDEEEALLLTASRDISVPSEQTSAVEMEDTSSVLLHSIAISALEGDEPTAETPLDLTTHGEGHDSALLVENGSDTAAPDVAAGPNVANEALPVVDNVAVNGLGQAAQLMGPPAGGEIAVIDLVPPGAAGEVNNNAQNDAAQMQLGL